MLILAGVSINLVIGNNGIITKAGDASNKTKIANVKDKISLNIGEWGIEKYTGTLKDFLDKKVTDEGTTLYITFDHSIEGGTTTVSPTLPFAVTQNGTYTFTVTGTVNGETSTKTVNVTVNQFNSEPKIGDYVNYTYDPVVSGYKLTKELSGYTNSSAEDGSQTIEQNTTTLQWRILNIDETTGTIDLVSATPTSNIVYFQGALGYNNGVYLLNDICAKLYSNSSKGITARSINLEDTEKHFTTAGLNKCNYVT